MKATRTVYCYYFPEVREIINRVVKNYPHETFLKSTEPGLDDFHLPVIEKFIRFHKKTLPKLGDFKFRYYAAGASEGIFHMLAKLKTENPEVIIYVLKGEYEGYREYAKTLNIIFKEVEENEIDGLQAGVFFLSNPSARDGNIISNEFVNRICTRHKVVFDAAYAGLTRENEFDVSNPNVIAVITSMSKPFGLYYYRIGFTFAREAIESLEGNKWFKNIFSLIIADKILSEISPESLYNRYKPMQEQIVKELNAKHSLNLKASDSLLLAYANDNNQELEKYRRDKFYRLCLTPYFLEQETKAEIVGGIR